MSLEIKLTDIFPEFLDSEECQKYKIHLMTHNGKDQPLNVYLRDEKEWEDWNRSRYGDDKEKWTKDYIFSLTQFYPEKNAWMFGGVFKVLERQKGARYVLEKMNKYEKYVGRLFLNFDNKGYRNNAVHMNTIIDKIIVKRILEDKYSGEVFPGFDKINHDFTFIENIFKMERADWKAALEEVKGVYLLSDKNTGKLYIGSAYSDGGIWSRWKEYIETYDGGNKKLRELVKEYGEEYVRDNFKFSILDIYKKDVLDEIIVEREDHWKNKLMTRKDGYNSN